MAGKIQGDRQVRFARILGIVFFAAGFIAIGFGWSGAAKVACADCQLPYLLSGGAAGLGLIIVGAVLFVLAQIRLAQLGMQDSVGQINQAVVRVAGLATAGPGGENGQVVAGQSTYHRPDCRLVQG